MSYEVLDIISPEIRIIKNFISKEEISKILQVKEFSENLWEIDYDINYPKQFSLDNNLKKPVSQWEGMSINITKDYFYDRYPLDKEYYLGLLERIKNEIINKFNINTIKEEQYLINRWRVGRDQSPHLDYFYEEDGDHDYEMLAKYGLTREFLDNFGKMFHTKHFVALIYLNNDYEGGELWFPEHSAYTIKPEPGTLVIFRGNEKNLHGVKKIESGVRYTISLFWEDFEYEDKMIKSSL